MVFAHFYFFLAYTTSTIFYHLHDDVIRNSAINLHLTFDLGFAHHRCPYSTVCGPGSLERFKRTHLGATDCLTPALPALMQSLPLRYTSAAAAGQCRNFFSSFLIIIEALAVQGRRNSWDAFICVVTTGSV